MAGPSSPRNQRSVSRPPGCAHPPASLRARVSAVCDSAITQARCGAGGFDLNLATGLHTLSRWGLTALSTLVCRHSLASSTCSHLAAASPLPLPQQLPRHEYVHTVSHSQLSAGCNSAPAAAAPSAASQSADSSSAGMSGVMSCSSNTRGPPHAAHGSGGGGGLLRGHSGLPPKLHVAAANGWDGVRRRQLTLRVPSRTMS